MSLFTQRGRIEVSSGDSELDSSVPSITDSADELIEELAHLTLAGHYGGRPRNYETSQLLQGRGITRRSWELPRPQPTTSSLGRSTSEPRVSPPDGPLSESRPLSTTHGEQRVHQSVLSDKDELEGDALALERMYRHLAREYAAGKGSFGHTKKAGGGIRGGGDVVECRSVGSSGLATVPANRNPRRKPDETARLRLLEPTKAQLARRVERYEKRKEREEHARRHPKRPRVPAAAVKRGTRLFLQAHVKEKHLKEAQAKQDIQKALEEKKECTFRPSVSKYAARLVGAGGYYPLEERFADRAAVDERHLRLRLQRAVEMERECTFQPVLSPGTEEFMSKLRRRREHRHRGRSSDILEAGEEAKGVGGGHRAPPRHEPFEPGERLYRDGGEHLLRQQVRRQRAAARDRRNVVGGGIRLSHTGAQHLADRFAAWAAVCAANREELRNALEQQMRGTQQSATKQELRNGGTYGFARSTSSSNFKGCETTQRVALPARTGSASTTLSRTCSSAPTLLNGENIFTYSSASPKAFPITGTTATAYPSSNKASSVGNPSASDCVAPATTVLCRRASSSAPVTSNNMDVSVRKEDLRIRLGALFYKYAVSPTASAVCLAQVRQQVRCYYPEDCSIVAALGSLFLDEQQPITKTEFMAALAKHVAQHGVQPWCLPHQNGLRSSAGVHWSPAGFAAANSTASTLTDVTSSSVSSELIKDGPYVSIPSWRATGKSNSAQCFREGVDFSTVTPIADLICEGRGEEKPLRTHIYSFSRQRHLSVPTLEPTALAHGHTAKASAGSSEATVTQGIASEKLRISSAASRSVPRSKHPFSKEAQKASVELLQGSGCHVKRVRRAADHGRTASEATREEGECTFRPTLTPHSVVLSDKDLKRRLASAQELQQRRQKLHLLRSALLVEGSGESGSPDSAQVPSRGQTGRAPVSVLTPPLTPCTSDFAGSHSGASPSSGLSPSVEISSLSCSTPRRGVGSASLESVAAPLPLDQKYLAEGENVGLVKRNLGKLGGNAACRELPTQAARVDISDVVNDGVPTLECGTGAPQTVTTVSAPRLPRRKAARAILFAEEV